MVRRALFCPVLAIFLAHPAVSQVNRTTPKLSDSCDLTLAKLKGISGSRAYVRLRYVIEALDSAEESVMSIDTGTKSFDTAGDPTLSLAALLTGADEGQHDLNCAAFLIDHYPGSGKYDKTMQQLLASSFRLEGESIGEITALSKSQIAHPEKHQSSAAKLQDAEKMAQITAAQNKAAYEIALATTTSLLQAVDVSDRSSKTTEYLTVSCDEYRSLVEENTALLGKPKSAYTQSAELIQKALEGHKCRGVH